MVIILNGSVGCGKTSVAWELQQKFDKAVMLDGDYIGAVHPFKIYDEKRIEYLYDTIMNLVNFHKSNGYNDFVINYVFEASHSLTSLVNRLQNEGETVCCYRITCSAEEQKKRIAARNTIQVEWELKRCLELNAIQEQAAKTGFIGKKIVTDNLTVQQAADRIWHDLNYCECDSSRLEA
ncbi:MAG: zeta toxin family protein [Spirochaetes bacterium]|nr:zeta toxin family protein [Spirochaetota bacterium]